MILIITSILIALIIMVVLMIIMWLCDHHMIMIIMWLCDHHVIMIIIFNRRECQCYDCAPGHDNLNAHDHSDQTPWSSLLCLSQSIIIFMVISWWSWPGCLSPWSFFIILLNNHYHEDHDQAAYLRTLAVLRAPPYLPRPPSFAQTQGFIQIMISHDGDDDGNQLWRW